MSIRTKITPNGNLLITADNAARRDLAEAFASGGYYQMEMVVNEDIELTFIPPEAIGALTDAPIIGEAVINDDGDYEGFGNVWWYPDYQVSDPWEELRRRGRVIFTLAPADDPAPRPMDAVSARVIAEMAKPRQEYRQNVRTVVSALIAGIKGRSMAAFVRSALLVAVVTSAAVERTNFQLDIGKCSVLVSERDDDTFYARIWPDKALHGPFRSIRAAVDYLGKDC
jgi:hypothetical protein